MANYYASPTGLSTNTGAIGSPWDLKTALVNASMTTSDTLYLRGGTYTGKFKSMLNGGTVRSYPGEWAVLDGNQTTTLNGAINSTQSTVVLVSVSGLAGGSAFMIDNEMMQVDHVTGNTVAVNRHWGGTTATTHSDGATVKIVGNQLEVSGSNTTYLGFEVTNSDTNRNDNGNANGIETVIRGSGVVQYNNPGNNYVNLFVHDNLNGFFIGSGTSNTTIYGCLVMNNGMYGDVSGHGLYLENSAGYSRVYNTLVFNNFNLGTQAYGVSGPYVGGDFRGVVYAGSGSPGGVYHPELIYGPASQKSPTANIDSCIFYHPPQQNGLFNLGYGAGVGAGVVTNNYFFGSGAAFTASAVDNLTFTGNKFDSPASPGVGDYAVSKALSYTWDNNTYYRTSSSNSTRFAIPGNGSSRTFASWQTATGFDTNSTINASTIPDTVIVQPNFYEAGRANIIIYAPSLPSSINVDLSTSGLANGQSYTIKNAFDYNGTTVATGTYSSGSPVVSLSLTGAALSVATPTGMGSTPPTVGPEYSTFIVVPGTIDTNVPGQPTALGATRVSNTQINLAWTLGSGTPTSVTLERSTDQSTWTQIVLGASAVSYSDTGRTEGAIYYYRVKSTNATGDSLYSDVVSRVVTGLHCYGAAPAVQ